MERLPTRSPAPAVMPMQLLRSRHMSTKTCTRRRRLTAACAVRSVSERARVLLAAELRCAASAMCGLWQCSVAPQCVVYGNAAPHVCQHGDDRGVKPCFADLHVQEAHGPC